MAGNQNPIFSRVGMIQGGGPLLTAAADYVGQNVNNLQVFLSDATNGSFVQRLRFKALGTNVATVARIYLVGNPANNLSSTVAMVAAVSGTPTGTPSGTGGTLATGSYFAKIQAVDQYGNGAAVSPETASVSVTGPTGSIAWAWTASTGAVSYRIFVGNATGAEQFFFTSTTNSYTQTAPYVAGQIGNPNDYIFSDLFIGEISLPATTASATAAGPEIDYIMNMALPPGFRLMVGLGTTVAAGFFVTAIGGAY